MSSHSAGGISDTSYISGLSNISYLSCNKSQFSGGASNNAKSQNGPSEIAEIDLEDIVGSESYISPEMVTSRHYSFASDLWALGVIIFQMLSDSLPFKGRNQDETFEKIKKGVFEMPQSINNVAQDLISRLLVLNPEERIGAQNLNDLYSHEYFQLIDF